MQQMDFFDKDDRLIREELCSMQRQIRGLFSRFNYLEQEWIDVMRDKQVKSEAEAALLWLHFPFSHSNAKRFILFVCLGRMRGLPKKNTRYKPKLLPQRGGQRGSVCLDCIDKMKRFRYSPKIHTVLVGKCSSCGNIKTIVRERWGD